MSKNFKIIFSLIILFSFCTISVSAVKNTVNETSQIIDSNEYTTQELEYIKNHKQIYIAGSNNLKPIQSYSRIEDKYEGILPEIFEKVSNISGIEFKYINKDEDWASYATNKQVEIVSGIQPDTNMDEYGLKSKIEMIKFPIDNEEKIISIGFTQIADDELIGIVKKTLNKINELDKEQIIISNIMEHKENAKLEIGMIVVEIILFIITLIFFRLYKKYKKETMQAKYIDNITKMGNYQNMELNFNNMITDDNRCAYCVVNMGIDVNHIEELYGYSEVEEILKYVAETLDTYVKNNEMFARIYKDSFIIVADFISDKNITDRIGIITEKIKEFTKITNKAYKIEVNSGIYFLKQTDRDLSQAVYNAMQARKEAKKQGNIVKNCTDALIMKTKKEKNLEKEIVKGFENNEFTTYVQPLISLHNEGFAALEALARWESPKIGLVKPNNFLDVLEQNNIIDKLDFLMYENACKMLYDRKKANKELFVIFCNFSRKTMGMKGFYEKLKEISSKYQVSERYIGIIITEGNLEQGVANLKFTIEKLRNQGYSVLLDDFGATLYSFRDIKEFPIDYLKISAKLTETLDDRRTIAIMKGIIDTAHSLNIKVICEDFKTRDNEKILRDIGCDIVQGNVYYQPIPTEEILKV